MTIYRWLDSAESLLGSNFAALNEMFMRDQEPLPAAIPQADEKHESKNEETLRMLLEAERLRSEVYLRMIEQAEEHFKIQIKKKIGLKPLKR